MSKQFSSLVPCGLVCYSPSSDLIATESSSRINVRSAKSLKVKKTYSCIDRVEKIEFSPDSALILCALYARSAVQVFSLSDTEWNCRIDEGIAGITDATWSPDSRNVIVISDYGVQISIWSLTSNQCHSISNPKHIPSRTSREINSHAIQIVCFSDCHRLMAVVHRHDLHDHIGVYSTDPWHELNKFQARSNDIAYITWTPSDTHIITVDSPLTYKFTVYTPCGEVVTIFEAYQHALGIRNLEIFCPRTDDLKPENMSTLTFTNSQFNATGTVEPSVYAQSNQRFPFVAIGSYDSKIRLLSLMDWNVIYTLPLCHPKDMDMDLLYPHMKPRLKTVENLSLDTIEDTSEDVHLSTADAESSPSHYDDVNHSHTVIHDQYGIYIENGLLNYVNETKENFKSIRNSTANTRNTVTAKLSSGEGVKNSHTFFEKSHYVRILPRLTAQSQGLSNNRGPVTSAAPPPLLGVSWLGWSADGSFLAARDSSYPRCLWVWIMQEVKLGFLIIQKDPILCARWRPKLTASAIEKILQGETLDESRFTNSVLAFCNGSSRIYFCIPSTRDYDQENVITWFDLPETMPVVSIEWSSDGSRLLAKGRDGIITCDVRFGLGAQGDQSVSEPIDQMAYSSPLKQSSFGLSHDIDDLNNSTPYLFKSMKLTPNASRK